jgi:hypothetical protein
MGGYFTFKVDDKEVMSLLDTLSGEDIEKAKRATLFRATNAITRRAYKEWLTHYPPRPVRAVKRRRASMTDKERIGTHRFASAFMTDINYSSAFVGDFSEEKMPSRKGIGRLARRKILRNQDAIAWSPRYLLDWFDRGTSVRSTQGRLIAARGKVLVWTRNKKGKYFEVRRKKNLRVGKKAHRGSVKGNHYLFGIVGNIQRDIADSFGRYFDHAMNRILRNKLKGK